MNILEQIVEKTRVRVQKEEQKESLEELKQKIANRTLPKVSFFEALKKDGMSIICEVKKASPSKGIIDPIFDYLKIAKEYENANADAISCLCEPDFFCGNINYLDEISNVVSIPILRKDFIINEYMIYQAKAYGASAILLIVSILSKQQLKEYLELAHSLDMDCLVEVHDEVELEIALESKARIIGVNNRDLKTFKVDLNTSIQLRKKVDPNVIFVSESGIKTHEDVKRLMKNQVDAILVGEALMTSNKKEKVLSGLLYGES